MFKKIISAAAVLAFASTAIAPAFEHHRHQGSQYLTARLHVLPSCTLSKSEGPRVDLNFRDLDATGTTYEDAREPRNASLSYVCSKWTHPRLTLHDDHRMRGDRDDFYLENGHGDKIAFHIWKDVVGGFEFNNTVRPSGAGVLHLPSNSSGRICLVAKLEPFTGPLVPGRYRDVVVATLNY